MTPVSPILAEKFDRVGRAARELEQALNELASHNMIEQVEARIDVLEFHEIQQETPRRIFSVKIGGTAQWMIQA